MNALTSIGTQENAIMQTIYERRSVRKYKNKKVSQDLIEEVIDAGRMAPTAINMQPWKFYVLTDKARILSLSTEIAKAAENAFNLAHGVDKSNTIDYIFHGAPVVIFITATKDDEWASLDIGMCAENIMLAAKSLGLDSCPIGLAKFVEQTSSFPKLKISASETVKLGIIIGYGDEHPEAKERKRNNIVYIV